MIIAGAGSGKTRVLTWKIAAIIESGVEPSSIMALTFTNKAAKEMKERVAAIVGRDKARICPHIEGQCRTSRISEGIHHLRCIRCQECYKGLYQRTSAG